MRIVTDGKKYAIARGRWFFTELKSLVPGSIYWYPYNFNRYGMEILCWGTLEHVMSRFKEMQQHEVREKLKFWTYKEKEDE